MDPKRLSALIRNKKKKMMNADTELVDVDYKPDLNPMDMDNMKQQGRIESTLDTPEKIDARNTDNDMSDEDALSVGLTSEEKTRMARLRKYLDTLDLNEK
jgi:hypothetical protein